ncbi:MAG: hypothetical protein Kow0081_1870 [Candidatus Dojkabacteria bacterium]
MTLQTILQMNPQQLSAEVLNKDDVQKLLQEMPNWYLVEDPNRPLTIGSGFDFNDFNESVDFVNYLADFAEQVNHHPDILIHEFNKVSVFLTTHSSGGVTLKDIYWAAMLDKSLADAAAQLSNSAKGEDQGVLPN